MVYLRTFTIKINKKSTQFMSFSDPTPQKTGSNLITSTKIIKNQPRWVQQTLIIYLRSLATVWIPSKTLRSSKVTNLAKPSQPWDDTSSSLNDGNSSFSEAMNSESSRSHLVLIIKIISVNKCSNSAGIYFFGNFRDFAWKLRDFAWKLREGSWLRIDQWVGQPFDLLTQLLGD